ncbi:hypothetical protein QBC41DRAFT_315876 [Cercophora samala]|uniref:Uncharacterized protein n=1 Tax=Cercophora samala TaxID=330535 RepID=A0AA39ZID5_9PEZI|nr:hypothetical protein QBC41DRAFT_315876 [Cercophora samala]
MACMYTWGRGPREREEAWEEEAHSQPRSNLKAATCPSKKARVTGVPNDQKSPNPSLFFLSRSKRSMFLLLQCALYAVGRSSIFPCILPLNSLGKWLQQTKKEDATICSTLPPRPGAILPPPPSPLAISG